MYAADSGITKRDEVAVAKQNVRLKGFIEFHFKLFCIREIKFSVCILTVLFAEESLSTGKLNERSCAAEMVDMTVSVNDILEVERIKSEQVHVMDNEIKRVLISAVKHNKTVARVNDMSRCRLCAYKIEVAENLSRLEISVPRLHTATSYFRSSQSSSSFVRVSSIAAILLSSCSLLMGAQIAKTSIG